jgi:hypothetical protein
VYGHDETRKVKEEGRSLEGSFTLHVSERIQSPLQDIGGSGLIHDFTTALARHIIFDQDACDGCGG